MAGSTWQKKMENLFKNQGEAITKRPVVTLLLCCIAIIGATHQLVNIRLDSSIESFLSKDHPASISINENRKHFGITDLVVVGVKSSDLFSADKLHKLRQLHDALVQEIPDVERVDSLLNARITRGEEDALIVEEFLSTVPNSPEKLAEKRQTAISHPLYRNLLISEDGTLTTLLVQSDFDPDQHDVAESLTRFCHKVELIISKHQEKSVLIKSTNSN